MVNSEEILETIKMVKVEQLDIRTVTLGINLLSCAKTMWGTPVSGLLTKYLIKLAILLRL